MPVAALAALGCTAYSADTSWRFAADYLDMDGTAERVAMFAAAELALFATALMARQNLNGPKQAPGLPGTLTWIITAVQILPAYAESGLVGGTVRAFVGPVMAAMLWHLAMGIELRHRTPDAASRSLAAVLVRQARERLLARLGIADQDADATRLIRERALSEAVALILRAESMTDRQRGKRQQRRLTERLHEALERADVDGDPLQDELLRKLATRKQAIGLASVTLPPRWEAPASTPARESGRSSPRAGRTTQLPRTEDAARPHPSDPGDDEAPPAARPQPARPVPGLPARAEAEDGLAPTGNSAGSMSDRHERKAAARKKRDAGKARASDEVILNHARRIHEETGSVGRDRVEDALRAAGYTVSSDGVGRVIREFKAQLKPTAGDPLR
ncbi:membrane protein [Streptomyces zinciresistens K42]|uniref:Membrane protein n=1 Tax=Streptomyces zinciresistens K42 TaxID=700597 RepID=G2G6B9_9ACTN|nr:membrane protein [Streptomyces zinciresistens K42]